MAASWFSRLFGRSRTNPSPRKPRSRWAPPALSLERLEDRLAPATVTDNGGSTTLQIDLDNANESLAIVSNGGTYTFTSNNLFIPGGVANLLDFLGFATNSLTLQGSGLTRYDTILVTDSATGTSVSFNDSGANAYSDAFSVILDGGSSGVTFNGASSFGTNALDVQTDRNITVSGTVSTSDGGISLQANQQATSTAGNFQGVRVTGTVSSTGTGNLLLRGRGGDDAASNNLKGVNVILGGTVSSTGTGSITIVGTGGAGINQGFGVAVEGASSVITSAQGAIDITGTGGAGTGAGAIGVVALGGKIRSTGTGANAASITINGAGATGTGLDNGFRADAGAVETVDGNVSITATTATSSDAIALANSGALTSTGTGTFTLVADSMELDGGTIGAGTNQVTLRQRTNNTAITLGSNVASTLGLNTTELGNITAGTLAIGNANSGAINLTAAIDVSAKVTTLALQSGAAITDGNATGTDLKVSNLALRAATGIGSSDALEISVTNLAFNNATSGAVQIANTGALTIASVNGLATSSSAGAASVSATSPVTFAVNTTAASVTAQAIESATTNFDNVTVNAGVTVTATTGDVTFEAGDRVVITGTASVQSTAGNVSLASGVGDTDGDGAMTLDGIVSAASRVTLNLNAQQGATQAGTGTITASELLLLSTAAGGSFTLTSATNNVATLAASAGGAVSYLETSPFTVGTVGATSGVTTTDGAISLTTAGANQLTIDQAVTAGGTGRNVTLSGGNNVLLNAAVTADGDTATINGGVGAINGAGLVTAATVDLDASTGIGNTTAVNLAAGSISADTSNGAIDVNNALATATTVTSLTTGTGAITFDQAGGGAVTFANATTTDGSINLSNAGANLTLATVNAGGAGSDVGVTTTAAGDITVASVTAADDVTMNAAGSILDDGVNGTVISGDAATLTAGVDIGRPGAVEQIDTTVNTWQLSAGGGAGVNGIWVTDTDAVTVTSATTTDGVIILSSGGTMSAGTITANGTSRIVVLSTTAGDIQAGSITATGNARLSAAGAITDLNAGATNITATSLALQAATGIGSGDALETAVSTLAASNTTSGNVEVSNTGDLSIGTVGPVLGVTVIGVTNNGGNVSLSATGAITQGVGAIITAAGLELLGTGPVTLTESGNNVTTLAANTTGGISYRDTDALTIGTVGATTGVTTGGALTLQAGGAVTQSAAITATGLELLGAGPYTLEEATNSVATLAASTTEAIAYRNAGALSLGTVGGTTGITTTDDNVTVCLVSGALSVDQAIAAGTATVRLQALSSDITGAGAITAAALGLRSGGNINLTAAGNDVDTLAATATGGFAFTDGDGFTIGTVTALGCFTPDVVGLTAGGDLELCVATGDLNITAPITAPANTVRLAATTGSITQSGTGTIAALNLGAAAGAAVSLGLDNAVTGTFAASAGTSVTFHSLAGYSVGTVSASTCFPGATGVTTTDGAVTLSTATGDLTVGAAVTAGGTGHNVSLTATTGNVLLNAGVTADGDTATITAGAAINGASVVTAATADLNAATGIGNTTAVNLAAGSISADSSNGAIDVNNALATATTVTSLTTGTGAITFDQAGGGAVTFTNATTTDGSINLSNAGANLTLTTVNAGGAGSDVGVTTTAAGDITVASVTAADDVTMSAAGSILDDGDNTTRTTGDVVMLTAGVDIGRPGAVEQVDTTADSWVLQAGGGAGVNGIWVTDSDAVTVTSATTTDGVIILASGGTMTATLVTTGGISRVAVLSTTAGDIQAGSITATGNARLSAAGAIVDNNGATTNVTAIGLALEAANGIGSGDALETVVSTLAASNSTAGNVEVTNTGALTIGSVGPVLGVTIIGVSNSGGNVLITAASPLTVANNVTASGNITLTATDSAATGDDLTIQAGVTVSSTASGNILFQAGDNFGIDPTASVATTAPGTITVCIDFGNADAGTGATATLSGAQFSPAVTVKGDSDDDTFTITGGPNVSVDGMGGTDTLVGPDAGSAWNITGANAGNITGVVTSFLNVENLTGGSGVDTFTFSAGGSVAAIDGAGGMDTITGPDAATIWNLTGANAGNITGIVSAFTNVENLAGGSNGDTFAFAAGGSVAGTITGGAGTDTLDYSALTTAVAVNLGLGTTGLSASLEGGQEAPPRTTTAAGTATLTYNALTKLLDVAVTVTDLAPALVTGFHLHRGAFGVNGPIIIDLQPLAPLVTAGTGFTFTATGINLGNSLLGGLVNEASLLGGITYINVHTAAAPAGLIRGQVFTNANVNLATGTATHTNGIAGIENAIGGSAADGLVGSFAANTLQGRGGNDTMVGGPGADTMIGGDNNDIAVWSNGDGSDIIDGEGGTDTTQVNGSLTANDVFTVNAGVGGRIDFDRLSPGPFSLDIGTNETLTVNGIGGSDSFTVGDLSTVTGLTTLNLNGLDGDDTFTTVPGVMNIHGGRGANRVVVDANGTATPRNITITNNNIQGGAGFNINYIAPGGSFSRGVEVNTGGGADQVTVRSTAGPTNVNTGGGADTVTIAPLAGPLSGALVGLMTVEAGAGSNTLVVDESASTTAGNVTVGRTAITGATGTGFAINYSATGGTFGRVAYMGGAAGDTITYTGKLPGQMDLNSGGGNDAFFVQLTQAILPDGLQIDGGTGSNTMTVQDLDGGAVIRNKPTGPASGNILVRYFPNPVSTFPYQNIQQVLGINDAANFVQSLYHNALGRNGAPQEIAAWVGVLNQFGRLTVARGIAHSPEGRAFMVREWYLLFVGRVPTAAESAPLVQALLAGQSEESVLGRLVGAAAARSAQVRATLVNHYYVNYLRRAPSAAEVSAWVNSVSSIGGIRLLFLISEEFFQNGL